VPSRGLVQGQSQVVAYPCHVAAAQAGVTHPGQDPVHVVGIQLSQLELSDPGNDVLLKGGAVVVDGSARLIAVLLALQPPP
jgi:hypothetical protein